MSGGQNEWYGLSLVDHDGNSVDVKVCTDFIGKKVREVAMQGMFITDKTYWTAAGIAAIHVVGPVKEWA